MKPEVLGMHVLLDCWGCNDKIASMEIVRFALQEAVKRSDTTLLALNTHQFEPHGVSAVAFIAESHISIHTWPEKNYLALDAFTCGTSGMPERAVDVIRELFEPTDFCVRRIDRGIGTTDKILPKS